MESESFGQKQVVLLKLPDSLYEAIKNKPQKLNLQYNKSQIELSLETQSGVTSFKGSTQPVEEDNLYIFSVDGQKRAKIKTKVSQRGALLPQITNQYKLQTQPEHSINVQKSGLTDYKYTKPMVFHLNQDHKAYVMADARQAAASAYREKHKEKRVRAEREQVKEQLFKLFGDQRYWKVKALAEETSQPEAYLKEILNEIAERVPSGTYRNHWQLKPEYRDEDSEEEPTKKQKT